MYSQDRSIISVFNGEIYNHRELAHSLQASGVKLQSNSDAEIIPHLYEIYGSDFVHHLRGMFAIALWDASKGEMLLFRDRVGKKPLLYTVWGARLMFASEARALYAAGWSAPPDFTAIDHVLAFDHLPLNSGAHQGLRSLPPGSMLRWDGQQLEVSRYWEWRPTEKKLPQGEVGERLERTLDEGVRIRMVSERPLGSFLSGGIDSTVVTALMARHHSGPVQTFSIGFADRAYDESGYARQVAEYLGTQHTELVVDPDPEVLLRRMAETFDQPFADSSAIPTFLLSELASKDVVVALSGDGGDEGFGGYVRYWLTPVLQRLNSALRVAQPAHGLLNSLSKMVSDRRIQRLVNVSRAQPNLMNRYLSMMIWMPQSIRQILWKPEVYREIQDGAPEIGFSQVWDSFDGMSNLDRMRAHDMAMYLPGDLLTKVDIASMACSLEVRSPFLDQEVLALAAQLPDSALLRGRSTKWALRQLAYRLVPREFIDRPKMGFGIPRAAWLRGPLREPARDVLLGDQVRKQGWFDHQVLERWLNEHDEGKNRDHYLWPVLMVELWANRCLS